MGAIWVARDLCLFLFLLNSHQSRALPDIRGGTVVSVCVYVCVSVVFSGRYSSSWVRSSCLLFFAICATVLHWIILCCGNNMHMFLVPTSLLNQGNLLAADYIRISSNRSCNDNTLFLFCFVLGFFRVCKLNQFLHLHFCKCSHGKPNSADAECLIIQDSCFGDHNL